MANTDCIVFIYLPGTVEAVPAGRFTHDPDALVGTFDYGRRYIERPDAMAVDPVSLPLGRSPMPAVLNDGLYGAFRDACPDSWGRRVIAYELGAVPESIGELDFMLRSSATRVGNLDFRPEPDSPEPEFCPPMFEQLDELVLAAAEIEQGQKVDPHHVHLLRQGTSMGGARPKCTVSLDNELWIAKFPAHGDKVDMPLVEYATFQLARACGLAVPETQIVEIAGRNVFLIRRFDREAPEDGWTRRGFISALSLMNWHERDHASWDYRSLAAEMRRYTHAEDMIELFRRMVFNILIRNTDDHPRNHGFLFDGIQVKLSPAYDLVPTFTLAGVGSDSYLAMGLGVHGRLATLENAISNCGQYGLSADSANEHVHDLVSHTRNWREVFSGCGVPNQIQQALVPTMDRSL